MADQRDGGIAWTDESWNPVRGCSRVSKGCEHCYAEGVARRFSGPGMPYEGLVRLDANGRGKARWSGVVRLVPERLGDPLRWRRSRRVFVSSMSDLFHESLSFESIAAVFGTMASAERHTFQVLTKRPARAAEFLRWATAQDAARQTPGRLRCLPNVWIGVSVEDQATADERIPLLLTLSAAVRFVSYEPALGPVDFDAIQIPGERSGLRFSALTDHHDDRFGSSDTLLDWVIVGGESGPGARPFDLAWMRSTIAACKAAGVPVFCKQLGAKPFTSELGEPTGSFRANQETGKRQSGMVVPVIPLRDRSGADLSEWPAELRVRQFPVKEVPS